MQIRFSFAFVFVFDKRYVLNYADQSRLRFVVKNICIPAYSFVLVLRCRLTNVTIQYEESHFDGLCLQRTNLVPLVPNGICVKSYYYYNVQFVRKKALAAL